MPQINFPESGRGLGHVTPVRSAILATAWLLVIILFHRLCTKYLFVSLPAFHSKTPKNLVYPSSTTKIDFCSKCPQLTCMHDIRWVCPNCRLLFYLLDPFQAYIFMEIGEYYTQTRFCYTYCLLHVISEVGQYRDLSSPRDSVSLLYIALDTVPRLLERETIYRTHIADLSLLNITDSVARKIRDTLHYRRDDQNRNEWQRPEVWST